MRFISVLKTYGNVIYPSYRFGFSNTLAISAAIALVASGRLSCRARALMRCSVASSLSSSLTWDIIAV
jgi:hypothetical protein